MSLPLTSTYITFRFSFGPSSFVIVGIIAGSILKEIACEISLKVLSEASCPITLPLFVIPK